MRSHNRRFNSIPAAAADSGDSVSFTSTHAQALPNCVIAATVASANEVFPLGAAPLHLCDGAARDTPAQQRINIRNACREQLRGLFDLERQRRWHSVGEFGFDLKTDCGGCRHNRAYSPYVRLSACTPVKLALTCSSCSGELSRWNAVVWRFAISVRVRARLEAMCGRYRRKSDKQRIADAFGVTPDLDELDLGPDEDIAPGSVQPVVFLNDDGERQIELMRWGFKLPDRLLFNARSEGIDTAKFWKDAFLAGRIIVPADGIFEWKAMPKGAKEAQI